MSQEAPVAPHSRVPSQPFADSLIPGEKVHVTVECMRETAQASFEECVIATTDARLLIGRALSPWAVELESAHWLAGCLVINGKEHADGSRLLVVRHEGGALCLYFSPTRAGGANALLAALGSEPRPHLSIVPTEPSSTQRLAVAGPPHAPVPTPTPATAQLAPTSGKFHIPDDVDPFTFTQFLHDLTQDDIKSEGED